MTKGISGNQNYSLLRGVDLDNAIFELQRKGGLSKELSELLHKADVAYLQDKEAESAELLQMVYNRLSGLDTDGDSMPTEELPKDSDFPELPIM